MRGSDPTTKHCPGCGRTLPPGAFSRSRGRWDGLNGICRDCDRERLRRRWQSLPEEQREEIRRVFREEYYPEHREEIISRVIETRRERKARQKAGVDSPADDHILITVMRRVEPA